MQPRPLGLDPDDPLVRTAVLGHQVQEWFESPVGAFIMHRVRMRLTQLEKSLKTIDPLKTMEVARLQAEIKHWESFASWIGEAIQAYESATQIIDGEQNAEDA
jgi:hypothetical protein